jgi:hypothetical protein
MMNKNSMIMRGCIAIVSVMMAFNATHVFAQDAEDKRPLGCKDLGYQFDLKILKLQPPETGDKQSLYFIFNNQSKVVNLYQMRQEDSTRSIYMNHAIRPRQWAVLSTSESEVRYICTMDDGKSSYGKVVDCADTLKVCEYARVKYGMNNRGNYWLVDSNTSGGAVYDVLRYGIIPR